MEGEKYIPVSTIKVCLADAQNGDVLDLTFFGDLRKQGHQETFLPKSLYVREEMHSVWAELLRNDANEVVNNQVLIGSPDVGKSVVFFLYALHCAQSSSKRVMFWRKTQAERGISLFCMESCTHEDAQKVRVRFHRTILFTKSINDIFIPYMQSMFPDLYSESGDTVDDRTSNLLVSNEVLMFVTGRDTGTRWIPGTAVFATCVPQEVILYSGMKRGWSD
jgi:hypothetical protein